jgi:hypothetical protein
VQEPRTAEQSGLMSRLTGWLAEPKSGAIPQPARPPAPMHRGVSAAGAGNR